MKTGVARSDDGWDIYYKTVAGENKPKADPEVRCIVSRSRNLARRDDRDIDRAVDKAELALAKWEKLLNQLSAPGWSFIDLPQDSGTPILNLQKINAALQWAGYRAVYTNLKKLRPQRVLKIYSRLWKIEDSFAVRKSQPEIRSCQEWTEEQIRGYCMSCYISLVLERYLVWVLQSHSGKFIAAKIDQALGSAIVLYDDNVLYPHYLRAYTPDTGFDEMLRIFGLEPPQCCEDRSSLARKLHLQKITA